MATAKKKPAARVAPMKAADAKDLTAKAFIMKLKTFQSADELRKIKGYFKSGEGQYGHGDTFIGVRMGNVFALAKAFVEMSPAEIEHLMESDIHEARAGAMSIMGQQAMLKKTTEARRKELYDLYLRRHDRINNWDLVDLAAKPVIGQYLADKPRTILRKLAKSKNLWERRTALYACLWFIMKEKTVDDTEAVCEILINEKEEIIQKALGGLIRCIGIDRPRLHAFLDRHAATMPRVALRYAVEKLSAADKKRYMAMGK
ncbi:MAG TPA: DNA alkylation repair protein [Hyphomonadaceae bacterium]|nr:DNA alkylation repair protein [Hyphomonadaceae bacterium]HPI46987.1 DNA alkylation repair protein [Hyphomonadaceae bacterium]